MYSREQKMSIFVEVFDGKEVIRTPDNEFFIWGGHESEDIYLNYKEMDWLRWEGIFEEISGNTETEEVVYMLSKEVLRSKMFIEDIDFDVDFIKHIHRDNEIDKIIKGD